MKLHAYFFFLFIAAVPLFADEGLWLLNQPPTDSIKSKYGFELTPDWLLHAQKSAVRFVNSGSGGFVSSKGLVITNHHVAADCLQKLSSKGKDFYRDGYAAATEAEELKCPDLELNVLQSIEDVTAKVNAAVTAEMTAEAAAAARRKVMAEIEKASLDATGLRSDVVTLYQGGLYHLYRNKKYTDVRLVFAPEKDVASFGGDVDNFEFPRYNLDICFFRVYENSKPIEVENYFRWNMQGPSENDLVFVVGFPGTTSRMETYAHLLFRRDIALPHLLNWLRNREAMLGQFSETGKEQRKAASNTLYSAANARKRESGAYQELLSSQVMETKKRFEDELRTKVDSNPEWKAEYGNAWLRIEEALQKARAIHVDYDLLERSSFDSTLFSIARHLVRLSTEKTKPGPERLREYRESNMESMELGLFSPAPIDKELEKAKIRSAIVFLAEKMGGAHPLVTKVLQGKSPADRAAELVNGTTLFGVEERRKLASSGTPAIESSTDPMIQLARAINEDALQVRKKYETEVEEPLRQAYSQIARARFAIFGTSIAPDATSTLRLSFGVVKGYEEDGNPVRYYTTLSDMRVHAEEHQFQEPFVLPEAWKTDSALAIAKTPLDFVSTADTIGGSSGSAVLNKKGEFVGINFDRNRHGLVRTFLYTEERARHIAVHSAGILEIIKSIYKFQRLVDEITGK